MVYWLSGIAGLLVLYLILCIMLGIAMIYVHVHDRIQWDNNIRHKHPFKTAIKNAKTLKGFELALAYVILAIFALPFLVYWIGTLPYDRKHGVKEVD